MTPHDFGKWACLIASLIPVAAVAIALSWRLFKDIVED